MKTALVLLALMLASVSHADSMSDLIIAQSIKPTPVYEVKYLVDGKIKTGAVNARSIEQVLLTVKQQLKLSGSDIVSVELKK